MTARFVTFRIFGWPVAGLRINRPTQLLSTQAPAGEPQTQYDRVKGRKALDILFINSVEDVTAGRREASQAFSGKVKRA